VIQESSQASQQLPERWQTRPQLYNTMSLLNIILKANWNNRKFKSFNAFSSLMNYIMLCKIQFHISFVTCNQHTMILIFSYVLGTPTHTCTWEDNSNVS
jgi:hypothetical protein